ncbi:hypothetical protein [Arthrobacter sp. ISL-72]|nr:hypothetical protein [Arthrobacter sp. ISL-72]MBT2596856.1 hypothetical protein [Arthrobacter sp. ISL-72]
MLHEENKHGKVPLFQRVFIFFLVYPELLVILVLIVLALGGLVISG